MSSAACLYPFLNGTGLAQSAGAYDGNFYVTVQGQGGWDVTSFCDPKLNTPGLPEINRWARTGNIQSAGNIAYAPFGSNQTFFDKYKNYMLVINGVDVQTNSHDVGVVHNWSGRLAEGYPSVPALLSAIYGTEMPIGWVNNGGFSGAAGLSRFTRLNSTFAIRNLAFPDQPVFGNGETWINAEAWSNAQASQQAALELAMADSTRLPWQRKNREIFTASRANAGLLAELANNLPAEEDLAEEGLKRQAQIALTAFQSGVAITADLVTFGFDTHDNHDIDQAAEMTRLTEGVDFLWDTAEQLGLADRLVVLLASDFGRTPYYNDGNGKDHWPIGSAVFMQKNASWGNRVVGATDAGHNALKINPTTLQQDDSGITIYPKHVMQAFRQLAGIDNHSITQQFPFFDLTPIDFFDPNLATAATASDPRHSWRLG